MRSIVSNTTPLIGLSIVGRFEFLKTLFSQVIIPTAVFQETTVLGKEKPGAEETHKAVADGWIQVVSVNPTGSLSSLHVDLEKGEAEAIAWAFENNADLLLIDEFKGRAKAAGMGINITGTIGVLLLAREAGLLETIQPEIDLLRLHGFRISDSLYKQILHPK